jgi:hypothetical protein
MSKITVLGSMTELVLKSITQAEFKKLKSEGVDGELYERLVKETDKQPSYLFGYSTLGLGTDFEVNLNGDTVHNQRSFVKCFKASYKPIVHIRDSWHLIITRTYRDGLSELQFPEVFDPNQLTFELNRLKISGVGYSGLIPLYLGAPIPFVSGWSDKDTSFIASPDNLHRLVSF